MVRRGEPGGWLVCRAGDAHWARGAARGAAFAGARARPRHRSGLVCVARGRRRARGERPAWGTTRGAARSVGCGGVGHCCGGGYRAHFCHSVAAWGWWRSRGCACSWRSQCHWCRGCWRHRRLATGSWWRATLGKATRCCCGPGRAPRWSSTLGRPMARGRRVFAATGCSASTCSSSLTRTRTTRERCPEVLADVPVTEAWISPAEQEAPTASTRALARCGGARDRGPRGPNGDDWSGARHGARAGRRTPLARAARGSTTRASSRSPTSAGVTVLGLGDLEHEGQRELAARLSPLVVDVVKVAHHGSDRQEPALAALVSARVAVVSVGANNTYGHPSPDALSLWGAQGDRDRAHRPMRGCRGGTGPRARASVSHGRGRLGAWHSRHRWSPRGTGPRQRPWCS